MAFHKTTLAVVETLPSGRVNLDLPYIFGPDGQSIEILNANPEHVRETIAYEYAKIEVGGQGFSIMEELDPYDHDDQFIYLTAPSKPLPPALVANYLMEQYGTYRISNIDKAKEIGGHVIYFDEDNGNETVSIKPPYRWEIACIYNQETDVAKWVHRFQDGAIYEVSLGDEKLDLYFAKNLVCFISDTEHASEFKIK